MSTVWPSRTTRQAPWRSDSGNGAPPAVRASPRAAAAGSSATTRSTSTTSRPSMRSRTLPPTSHASGTGASARTASRPGNDMLHPSRPRRERRHDLVVDRPGHPRPLLGQNALLAVPADERHGVARLNIAIGADHECQLIHAHRRRNPPATPAHEDVRLAREQAGDAVRVAGRGEPDPGRLGRDEAAAVAGALARLE